MTRINGQADRRGVGESFDAFAIGEVVLADGRFAHYAFANAGSHYVYAITHGMPVLANVVQATFDGAPRQLQGGTCESAGRSDKLAALGPRRPLTSPLTALPYLYARAA